MALSDECSRRNTTVCKSRNRDDHYFAAQERNAVAEATSGLYRINGQDLLEINQISRMRLAKDGAQP